MGSAISSLNSEDSQHVSKHLKEKYELLVKDDKHYNEQELQEKLTKEYHMLLKEIESTKKSREQDPASSSCNSAVVPTAAKRRGSKDVAVLSDEKQTIKRKGSRDDDNSKSVSKTAARSVNSPTTNKSGVAGGGNGVDLTKKASSRIAASGGSSKQMGNSSSNGRRRSFDTNQANNKKLAPASVEPSAPPSNLGCASHDSNTSSSPSKRGGRNPSSPTKASSTFLDSSPSAAAGGSGNNPSDVALLTAGNEVVDSWDSVTQQPYCKICCMAFKSENFLDRHVKFSDLHATNVKKLKGELSPLPIPAEPVKLAPLVKQIEGEHYKLLYTGSKFFWRTQETIDIHIYLHILPNCLEIISYDTIKSKETNRIYLDYGRLMEIIQNHPSVAWRNNITCEEKERDGKAGAEDKDKDNNELITTFILQRLQLSSAILSETSNSIAAANIAAVTGNILVFTKLTGDDFLPEITTNHPQRSPILDKTPSVVIPINIVRRRRTNAEEIDATINELNNDRLALISATGKAEKIASLVYASASALASKKWYSDLNPIRKRWIWAIRLVIRQKHVAEVTKVLEAYEAKLEAQKKQAALTEKNSTIGKSGVGVPATRSKEI
jgi:hypothetical protein